MMPTANMSDQMAQMWCQIMHPDAVGAVNGKYRCCKCMRVYDIPRTGEVKTVPKDPPVRTWYQSY